MYIHVILNIVSKDWPFLFKKKIGAKCHQKIWHIYTNGKKKLHSKNLYIFFYDQCHMVFWPSWYIDPGFSFVYHSRLTICDCLRFTKVCFCPYTLEKQFCLNDINSSVIPCLDENQRLRTIGMLQAGLAQNVVARHFGCHRNTILSLWRQFRQSGSTRDRRRSGRPRVMSRRPRVMSRRQDNHIRLVHLRNRFQTSHLHCKKHPRITTDQL